MDPRLRERLAWRTAIRTGVGAPTSTATMARAAILFGALGTVIGAVALALPNSPNVDESALAIATGCAALIAVFCLLAFDRLPVWGFQAMVVAGTVVASAAIKAWGTGSVLGPLPYLWIALFAAWFFSLRASIFQLVVIGACFAGVLALEDVSYTPAAGWAATMITLGITVVVVSRLRDSMTSMLSELADAVRRDPLTQLLNRRGFESVFDLELERARRSGGGLSVIVGDLDDFKGVNDRLGHAAGDDALRKVAEAIEAAKRNFDSGARIGGEEFAVLAPDSDEHGAYILAERLRSSIAEAFRATTGLTISFGVVSYPLHGQTPEALLQAGDQALYAAKRLGRNRTVISSAEVPGILSWSPRGREPVELGSLLSLAEALDVRDSGNAAHSRRVGRFAELMARELGLPPSAVERVRIAGVLHDVGRVGVPDVVLLKEGPLTEEDWTWVRSHPEIGARMLETTDFDDIREWIHAHHERPDGSGYPDGLTGPQLPLEAAILGVADAYEGMTSERPHRHALDAEQAAEELRRGSGQQFDQRAVEAFLRVV
jgi:diguanylate cyclase (GGDEF)-like protein/putative nucleotidyltransferase with HDIG domain